MTSSLRGIKRIFLSWSAEGEKDDRKGLALRSRNSTGKETTEPFNPRDDLAIENPKRLKNRKIRTRVVSQIGTRKFRICERNSQIDISIIHLWIDPIRTRE
jgi:hypothetical protein